MTNFRQAVIKLILDWKKKHNWGDKELTKPKYKLGKVVEENTSFYQKKNRQSILYDLQEQLKIDNDKSSQEQYDDDLLAIFEKKIAEITTGYLGNSTLRDEMNEILKLVKTGRMEIKQKKLTLIKPVLDNLKEFKQNVKLEVFKEIFKECILSYYKDAVARNIIIPKFKTYSASSINSSQSGFSKALETTATLCMSQQLVPYVSPVSTAVMDLSKSWLSDSNHEKDSNVQAIRLLASLASDSVKVADLIDQVLVETLRDNKLKFLSLQTDTNINAFALKFANDVLYQYIEKNQSRIPTFPIMVSGQLQVIFEQCFDNIAEYKLFIDALKEEKSREKRKNEDKTDTIIKKENDTKEARTGELRSGNNSQTFFNSNSSNNPIKLNVDNVVDANFIDDKISQTSATLIQKQ